MASKPHTAPLQLIDRRFTGRVYIGVAASDFTVGRARDSIWAMTTRHGDTLPQINEFTKGVEARQAHVERFLKDERFDFILHLDGDMGYPQDFLERLRSHGLPCVTGLYFRRTYNPMVPLWYEDDGTLDWPMQPFRDVPQPGRMYRLAATGAGAWLIHRSVYEAVRPLLGEEDFWLEDDMDVYPHSLKDVLSGRETLRMLRGKKDRIGADVRLGYFIRRAGFTIWGDAAASCEHFIPYGLSLKDWVAQGPEVHRDWVEFITPEIARFREEHLANAASVANAVTWESVS